jgi:hypothetical protein
MLFVNVGGVKHKIFFHYLDRTNLATITPEQFISGQFDIKGRGVRCIIRALDVEPATEVTAESHCNEYYDNFVRATGRKKALERALKATGWDKPIRTEIWKAYHLKTSGGNGSPEQPKESD